MAQYIGVVKVGEKGQVFEEYKINFAPLQHRLSQMKAFSESFPMLSSIDEYGGTYFNRVQQPRLVQELKTIKKLTLTKTDKKIIELLINSLNDFTPHEYIKFTGD